MECFKNIPVLRQLNPYIEDFEKKVLEFVGEKVAETFLSYLLYGFKVGELDESVKNLRDKIDQMEQSVDVVRRNGNDIADPVQEWFIEVKKIIKLHEKFCEDKGHPYTMYSKGYLPKPGVRYRLAKEAYRLAKKVDSLCNMSFPNGISSGRRRTSVDSILSVTNFQSFNSRKQVTKNIIMALKDASIKMVGVYGMGGVGKTTLIKKLASKVHRDKLFDVVNYVRVTEEPDIKKIQGELAFQLHATLNEEAETGRKTILGGIFKMGKKNTLVILDDLWDKLDLEELGISIDDVSLNPNSAKDTTKTQMFEGGTSGDGQAAEKEATNDSKMLKILLISRNKEVLCDKMHVKNNSCFLVKGLDGKEMEVLFKEIVKMDNRPPEFELSAAKISSKCGGLPATIFSIEQILQSKSYQECKEMLGQLERQEITEVTRSILLLMRPSFKSLQKVEQSTFLLCAQLGYHPQIMDLVKYCIGMSMFEGVHTIRETRKIVLKLVKKLKDSSLLIDSYSDDRFSMDDMIRQSALSIAFEEQHFFTKQNGELVDWPQENEFEKYNCMSIHNCKIYNNLPDSVSCPRLKIFHVDRVNPSFSIPEGFFSHTSQLRALILNGVDVSNFCASIECLKDLRILCLEKCMLGDDISFIGKLEKLRILSLSGSRIKSLPIELFKRLKNLKLLDISNCSELREIPPKMLSSSLEELYMRNSVVWESKENQSENPVLDLLRQLQQLQNLDICLSSVAALSKNLFRLNSYKIVIGNFQTLSGGNFNMLEKYEASRVLALQIKEANCNVSHNKKGLKKMLEGVKKMLLGQLTGVRNLFCEFKLEKFPCLKELSIVDNSDLEYIIDPKAIIQNDVFPNLESLCLSHCDSMKSIVPKEEDQAAKINFPKLCSLALDHLHNFTGVYSDDQDGSDGFTLFNGQVEIPNLESLELSCMNMKEIISSQSKCFENLIKLNMKNCPQIQYLFSFSMAKSMKKLKCLSLSACGRMVEIFKHENEDMLEARNICMLSSLEEIHLNQMEQLTSIWPSEASPDSFSSLNSLSIANCSKLVTVLPSHMVGRFGTLESLRVVDCDSMEQIFHVKHKEPSAGDETNLKILEIDNLKNLKHIWNGDPDGILIFERLHSMEVTGCHVLKYLFPVSVAKGLQELDSLYVSDCGQMEEVITVHGGNEESDCYEDFKFPKVSAVEMTHLPELKCFFKGRHSVEWPKLKVLSMFDCDQLEAFKKETKNSKVGPIFLPEEIMANLEAMKLNMKEIERLKLCVGNYSLDHLKHFFVVSCPSSDILYQFLNKMPSLERLTLCDDSSLTKLVPIPENIAGENLEEDIIINDNLLSQLKYLKLENLNALENIGFERDQDLQDCLEHLYIRGCEKLNNLAHSSVTLNLLTTLELHQCVGVRTLMGISTAKSLVQLVSLKITGCEGLKKVVEQQNDDNDEDKRTTYQHDTTIVFMKLMTLELVDLQSLLCFCSFDKYYRSLDFPLLEKLVVSDCPNMKIFCEQAFNAPNLQVIEMNNERQNWSFSKDSNDRIQKMILMTWLASCTHLSLADNIIKAGLADIWLGKIPLRSDTFKLLRTLVVEKCEFLSTVIPSHLLDHLSWLEKLEVRRCNSAVAIFEVDRQGNIQFSSLLKYWYIRDCEKLNNLAPSSMTFTLLRILEVQQCVGMESLMRFSTAKSLVELVSLKVIGCTGLTKVVAQENNNDEDKIRYEDGWIIFSKLKTLELANLQNLSCFSNFNIDFPSLEDLKVADCPIMITFCFGHYKTPNLQVIEINHEQNSWSADIDEPLNKIIMDTYAETKRLASCTHLSLADNIKAGLADIWLGKIPLRSDTFKLLRTLEVEKCEFLSTVIPSHLLNHLSWLETLEVRSCNSAVAIFEVDHKGNIQFSSLLKHWYIRDCEKLNNLGPSSMTFTLLTTLEVHQCVGMESLMGFSTAKSLVELESLKVIGCTGLTKVVASENNNDEDNEDGWIIFSKLRTLELANLQNLSSFSKFNIDFPSLEFLKVTDCPKMISFCFGCYKTPNLQVIEINDEQNRLSADIDGQLNKIIVTSNAKTNWAELLHP